MSNGDGAGNGSGRETPRGNSTLRDNSTLRESATGGLMAPIYSLLERALNDALRYDPATLQRLAQHKGRVLAIECLQPPVNAYFLFTVDGVEIYDSCDTSVDGTIRAGAIGLLRQLASENPDIAPAGGAVQVVGDARFVQEIVKIARDVDIDWEEPLARILGDVAARQIGELLRGAAGFLKRAANSLRRDSEDFLRHEMAMFPPKHAMREFLRDIDDLRLDTDRAQARIQSLRARIDALAGKQGKR